MSPIDDADNIAAAQAFFRENQQRWEDAADELIAKALKKGLEPLELYELTVARGRELSRTIELNTNKLQILTAMTVKLHAMF